MGQKLHNRIEIWKKLLLDFGKRNRLINFLEGKRNNVKITTPSFDRLWELVDISEKEIVFPYAKRVQVDEDGEEVYLDEDYDSPVEEAYVDEDFEEIEEDSQN